MNAASQPAGARASGFTLIELLIAFAVLGLLFAAAFGSLSVGARSWERGLTRADENQDLRRSVDFLRRQIAQLTPLTEREEREERIVFTGRRDVTQFVAPGPESVATGFVIVTVGIDRSSPDVSVWFSVAPLDPGNEASLSAATPWQRTLLAELADAKISYFGAQFDDETGAWHDEWAEDATQYPGMVRIASMTTDGTEQPELFFRIRARERM